MTHTIQPISHRSTNQKVLALTLPLVGPGRRVVDVGAGEGYFTSLLGEALVRQHGVDPAQALAACDVHPEQFKYGAVRCDPLPPTGELPYADGAFDVTCSLEVVEHVEDQFKFCRELLRITRPGGTVIVSTPNVLNVNSRFRILHSGFPVLFDPLPQAEVDVVHTSGHIHPISWYYLAFALRRAGATDVRLATDRTKNSARFMALVFGPLIVLGHLAFRARMARKRAPVMAENAGVMAEMRSLALLTARSVIAVARK